MQGFPGQGPPIPTPGLQAYGAPCADQHGVQHPPVYFCPVYTTIWNTVFGFNLYTPSIKLNSDASPYQTYYFNASFNKQYQWNSLPHWINTSSENFSISRQFSHALNTYVGYQILNTGDYYINGGYTPCHPVNSFYCPLSFTSFRGVSTQRTTSLGINDAPTPEFNLSLLVRHHVDFPIPVPGVFGLPPNNIIGQPLYTSYLGQAPYDATGEVRFKILSHMMLDVSRTLLLVRQSVSHAVLAAHLRGSASADMKRAISTLVAISLAILLVAAGASTIVVSGQLLAYQDGYVFFTSGDGFRVAHNVVIHDAKTGGATTLHPAPRIWARATFDASGTVTELDLSRDPLPAQGNFADVTHFAVALSSPIPNPDLLQAVATPAPGEPATVAQHFSGRPVLVTFIVQVPPYTPFTSSIYMATDQSGWNAQAIPMDRVDALHYQITRRFNSGTIFRYLYDRGSLQTPGNRAERLGPRRRATSSLPTPTCALYATRCMRGKMPRPAASIRYSRRSCRRPTIRRRSRTFRRGYRRRSLRRQKKPAPR